MAAKLNRFSNRELMDRFFNRKVESEVAEEKRDSEKKDQRALYYAIVRNIPHEAKSKDLRSYFSSFTENGKLACFHFRHRPELQAESTSKDATNKKTCCCMVSFQSIETREDFIQEFNKRHWLNAAGMEITRRCFIDRVLVRKDDEAGSSSSMKESDIHSMIELKPPSVMPNGNVGTPSEYFLEQIRLCKLPSSLIPKLGLQIKRRKRKFESVPFKYEQKGVDRTSDSAPDDSLRRKDFEKERNKAESSIQDEPTPDDPTEKHVLQSSGDNEDGADDDDDQCEEWERHEALHDDVTEQDRTKPKKYEEEMEIVWEKGGPGLVWYTDKNYWDEREKGTDCDWAWADDWDVDYSVYYEGKSAAELDARHAVEIREDQEFRDGKREMSVFTRKLANHPLKIGMPRKRRSLSDSEDLKNTPVYGFGGDLFEEDGNLEQVWDDENKEKLSQFPCKLKKKAKLVTKEEVSVTVEKSCKDLASINRLSVMPLDRSSMLRSTKDRVTNLLEKIQQMKFFCDVMN
ncbi:unnamed protein product [Caenorhabditis auriculariae]|uniref:RRM domain-containing protein n=1 Tax=Caenorhabditis auriculariae TaxID=2777116 RepID=A0A8S1HNH0_9PELO|nr:unnamed protein product [Caenorhabditis auriculariae]